MEKEITCLMLGSGDKKKAKVRIEEYQNKEENPFYHIPAAERLRVLSEMYPIHNFRLKIKDNNRMVTAKVKLEVFASPHWFCFENACSRTIGEGNLESAITIAQSRCAANAGIGIDFAIAAAEEIVMDKQKEKIAEKGKKITKRTEEAIAKANKVVQPEKEPELKLEPAPVPGEKISSKKWLEHAKTVLPAEFWPDKFPGYNTVKKINFFLDVYKEHGEGEMRIWLAENDYLKDEPSKEDEKEKIQRKFDNIEIPEKTKRVRDPNAYLNLSNIIKKLGFTKINEILGIEGYDSEIKYVSELEKEQFKTLIQYIHDNKI